MKTIVERSVLNMASFAGCMVLAGAALLPVTTAAGMQPAPVYQSESYDYESAMAEAAQFEEQGLWRQAADAYKSAMDYDPSSIEARDGYQYALTMMNEGSTIEGVDSEIQVQREKATREFDASYAQAQQLLSEKNFDQARLAIVTAKVQLDQARGYLASADLKNMMNRANDLEDEIGRQRTAHELALEQIKIDQVRVDKEREQLQRMREREQKINANLLRIRQLQMEMKYGEALQIIDEILFLDEHNPAALTLRDALSQTRLYQDYQELIARREHGYARHRVDGLAATIAPVPNLDGPGMRSVTGILQYPQDWPQLSNQRGNDTGFQETAADRSVFQRLSGTEVPIDFQNNTFEQVMNYYSQVTGVTVYVDWKALDFIGISRDDDVSLQLNEVPANAALERILEQVGSDFESAAWDVQNGILTISSKDALRKRVMTVVYDIRDLLFEVPYFDNAPELNLSAALNQGGNRGGGGGGGGSGGGGGGGGFGGGGGGGGGGSGGGGGGGRGGGSIFGDPDEEPERLSREELVAQIVSIIQENVDPEGWRDLGGDSGSLQELNGNLIITNTPSNHRNIEGLLSQLREIRALQINVESRFLEVNTDWFEQIGIDLDLYFNTDNAALSAARDIDPNFNLSDFFDPDTGERKDVVIFDTIGNIQNGIGVGNTANTGGSFGVPTDTTGDDFLDSISYITGPGGVPIRNTSGFAPIGLIQDGAPILEAIADLTDFGSSVMAANPALSVGIQFLDDVQVDLLIEATQADRRSVVLTAPRLTFFNGQRSWVAVTTTQAFVSGLTAVAGDASGAFQPQIGQLREGFVLDVEGVVSADRRYVTMTVIASLSQNAGFRESDASEFGGAAGGNINNGGGGGGGGAVGGSQFTGRIELPQITVSLVQTTVSVPDRGTILLGGQRSVREIEVETGVPVLSKIPFINRFFTNRVTSKQEQTLLILIRPEIIIQQENEDMLFPGLSDTLGGSSYMR